MLNVHLYVHYSSRPGDFMLKIARLDTAQHTAALLDLGEVGLGALFHTIGQSFDEIGARKRVDGVHHAGLVSQHLLRAQRNAGGFVGGQCQRLIHTVGVQALGASHHGGKRFTGRAHNIQLGLLRRE